MHLLFMASSNIVLSVLLGALAMAGFAIFLPIQFSTMLDVAGGLKNWMINLGIPPQYNNIIRLILHESTILFSFFTVCARILFALVAAVVRRLAARSPGEGEIQCPSCRQIIRIEQQGAHATGHH